MFASHVMKVPTVTIRTSAQCAPFSARHALLLLIVLPVVKVTCSNRMNASQLVSSLVIHVRTI